MKKIIILLIVAYVLGLITIPIINICKTKELKERIIYEITIDIEYINLRSDINLNDEPIMKVYKGETYQVVEYYEGNAYNWYRIIYEENKTGWLASGKTKPWVTINKEV